MQGKYSSDTCKAARGACIWPRSAASRTGEQVTMGRERLSLTWTPGQMIHGAASAGGAGRCGPEASELCGLLRASPQLGKQRSREEPS